MENWKRTLIQGAICVGVLCLIWGGYFLALKYGIDRILDIKGNDFSWVYQVDSVDLQGGKCVLKGFAFKLNTDAKREAFEIVLQDIETEEKLFLKMEYNNREDVNEYFACDYDYAESGFSALIDTEKVNGRNYEVLLRVVDERDAYRTGTYLSDGELMYVNPLEYQTLEIKGTDLEEIINQGIVRVYRPDYGMYVYQYDNELYWIAEPEYGFVEGNTYVQYQLDTTQIERLPKTRLENEWYCDDIGFAFSKYEINDMDTGKYRVAKREIPKEYSVRKIWTGNYITGWIWIEEFFPYYFFE